MMIKILTQLEDIARHLNRKDEPVIRNAIAYIAAKVHEEQGEISSSVLDRWIRTNDARIWSTDDHELISILAERGQMLRELLASLRFEEVAKAKREAFN
jgi:hypothetical protein